MTNFIEEQTIQASELAHYTTLYDHEGTTVYHFNSAELQAAITQTITNTLNHIKESGLLEEKKLLDPTDHVRHAINVEYLGHNTLARAIKAHLDKLINPTK